MTNVRVVSWNIKDFKGSTFTKHGNRILELLYDSTGARLCDVFVIVEPFSKIKKFGVGSIVTTGAGVDGILALYFALRDKDAHWKAVPPRLACKWPKSDMVAIFYHSQVVTLDGPDTATPGAAIVTKTKNPNGHPLPWAQANTDVGKIRYYNAHGAEINFYGRRPYLVRFETAGPVKNKFQILALHAPPDARYPDNAAMVENLANIREITVNRGGTPVAICGDFNVCPLNTHACLNKHQQRERDALNDLVTAQYTSQNGNRRTGCKSSAKAQKDAYAGIQTNSVLALDDISTHAYDHVLTQGFGGGNVQNVGTANVVAEDAGFANALTDAQNGKPHPVKGIVRRWMWATGVSDHLPVRFTLVV